MAEFQLVPVDGGDPVHLPPGETVLGRGPFLGVSDKRVSRHHGLLDNVDGQLRLKPTHLNPCFVQSSLAADPQPLQRDAWHRLHPGDFFSLLPDRFVYQVVATGEEERTPRNSQMFEEEELPVSAGVMSLPAVTPHHDPTVAAAAPSSSETGSSRKQTELSGGSVDSQTSVPPSTPRKRVLPSWMMSAAAQSPSTSRVQSAVPRKQPAAPPGGTKRAAAPQATPTSMFSPEEAELSEEEEEKEEKRPKKRRRKMSDEEEKPESKTVRPSTSGHRSEGLTLTSEVEGRGNAATRTSGISQSEEEEDETSTNKHPARGAVSNGGSASKPRVRTPCPYGKDCYRKNPLHFQDCSHPGDTDYQDQDGEEDEDRDRPECPYGTDCYRTNPLHRKEYKHTKRPARVTRKIVDDEDDEDDEDDNNSFINDDSEDGGDDSDYAPPDSDDSGRDDIQRLRKEAKAFLKRRT